MTTTEESVDDFDVLERVLESRAEEMHTALPGKVVRYEPGGEDGRQKADVQPVIRRLVGAEKGVTRERMPVLRAVPVIHPRWGSWYIHAPLAPGDKVLIVCLERDASQWLQSGEESDPVDRRGHHLSHAVCIPGLFPNAERLPQQPSDEMVIGKDGGPTITIRESDGEVHVVGGDSYVALADKVDALWSAFVNASPVSSDGGAALQTAVKNVWNNVGGAGIDPPQTVAAEKVKAK